MGGKGATFHHNLLAHHTSRNPRFCGSRYSGHPDLEKVDHRNNVIYNWGSNSCNGVEGGSYYIVNNFYKAGPATGSTDDRIIDPNPDDSVWGLFYINGNYVDGYPDITEDNWNGGVQGVTARPIEYMRAYEPFDDPTILNQTPDNALLSVLADAGVVRPVRDTVDARIVYEAETGTATYGGAYVAGSGIIDTPSDVGGWPVLSTYDLPTDADGRALEPENPYPENNDENVEVATILTWENGNAATSYDVYFGTGNHPVNLKGNQTATSYDPGDLLDSTVYYWRVDAVNEHGTTTGNVWRFTSELFHEAVNA